MTSTTWHAPPEVLERFAVDPASLDDVTAASIEAHLVACAGCRRTVAGAAPVLVDVSWAAVADAIDRPKPNLIERLLERVGLPSTTARLLGATFPLRAAGLVAMLVLAGGAVALSRSADADGPFLVLAPLVPLGAVAAASARIADPGGEAAVATPLHGAPIVVRRTVAALAVTFVVLGAAALALPNLSPSAAAWVLPGLALTLSALALAIWTRMEVAVWGLATAWMVGVGMLSWIGDRPWTIDTIPVFTAAGQAGSAVVAMGAAAVLVARRDRLATLEAFR